MIRPIEIVRMFPIFLFEATGVSTSLTLKMYSSNLSGNTIFSVIIVYSFYAGKLWARKNYGICKRDNQIGESEIY